MDMQLENFLTVGLLILEHLHLTVIDAQDEIWLAVLIDVRDRQTLGILRHDQSALGGRYG